MKNNAISSFKIKYVTIVTEETKSAREEIAIIGILVGDVCNHYLNEGRIMPNSIGAVTQYCHVWVVGFVMKGRHPSKKQALRYIVSSVRI